MSRSRIIEAISGLGIIPCWRHDDTSGIIEASRCLSDVGMTTVELTMTTPGNLRLIERAASELPAGTIIGAGTVLDAETARMAILAGAHYIVSPALVPELVPLCHRYDVALVMGVCSPTEILTAKSLGADMLKIFPGYLGGPAHLAEMRAVFPGIRTAVGGINLEEIPGFLSAGADCAVIGLPKTAAAAYQQRRFDELTRIVSALMRQVATARSSEARERFSQECLGRYLRGIPELIDGAPTPAGVVARHGGGSSRV